MAPQQFVRITFSKDEANALAMFGLASLDRRRLLGSFEIVRRRENVESVGARYLLLPNLSWIFAKPLVFLQCPVDFNVEW